MSPLWRLGFDSVGTTNYSVAANWRARFSAVRGRLVLFFQRRKYRSDEGNSHHEHQPVIITLGAGPFFLGEKIACAGSSGLVRP